MGEMVGNCQTFNKTNGRLESSRKNFCMMKSTLPETNIAPENGWVGRVKHQVSHEKKTGWLGYIGDYTTQIFRDYNKINKPL